MKGGICTLLIMLLACSQPTSSRAYFKYVPHEPPAKRYKVVRTIQVTATKYIKPKREDYATLREFRKAQRLNGKGNETFTGTKPLAGRTISANLKHFKPGTIVRIKELNMVGCVEDTGEAMRRNPNQIDIFTNSKRDAEIWGKRKVTMEILRVASR